MVRSGLVPRSPSLGEQASRRRKRPPGGKTRVERVGATRSVSSSARPGSGLGCGASFVRPLGGGALELARG